MINKNICENCSKYTVCLLKTDFNEINRRHKINMNIKDCPCTICIVATMCGERCERFLEFVRQTSINESTKNFYKQTFSSKGKNEKEKI